jgi:hypothetical protein
MFKKLDFFPPGSWKTWKSDVLLVFENLETYDNLQVLPGLVSCSLAVHTVIIPVLYQKAVLSKLKADQANLNAAQLGNEMHHCRCAQNVPAVNSPEHHRSMDYRISISHLLKLWSQVKTVLSFSPAHYSTLA